MGTGGNLPTSVTQTISFYNTTGVIEKEKNIYFCPFITQDATKTVRDVWLTKFTAVTTHPVDYQEITISNWNPQDRTLKIKGNADDFRAVNSLGYALNYAILTRTIVGSNGTTTTIYKYAFFVEGVTQAGLGTIQVDLLPDHFTTAFYLNDTRALDDTLTYQNGYLDIFNPIMKNNFVARQHYDRYEFVDLERQTTYETNNYSVTYRAIPSSPTTKRVTIIVNLSAVTYFYPSYGELTLSDIVSIDIFHNGSLFLNLDLSNCNIDVVNGQYFLLYNDTVSLDYFVPISTMEIETNYLIGYREKNLNIFSQIEETFKYKRQFRDYHKWLNYGNPNELDFTVGELEEIEEHDNFDALPESLRLKIIEKCLCFVNIVLNKQSIITNHTLTPNVKLQYNDIERGKYCYNRYSNSDISKGLTTVIFPSYIIPKELKKYKGKISTFFANNIKLSYTSGQTSSLNIVTNIYSLPLNKIYKMFAQSSDILPYVVNVYITKESTVRKGITFASGNMYIRCYELDSNYNTSYDGGNMLAFIPLANQPMSNSKGLIENVIEGNAFFRLSSGSGNNYNYTFGITDGTNFTEEVYDTDNQSLTFAIGFINNDNDLSCNLNLAEVAKTRADIRDGFSDPVLTFNPYSFYGISYLGRIESILNKVNYYEQPNIKLEWTVSITDTLRYSVLPIYTLEGLEQRFYSEGLESTIANNIIIATDKLDEYIIANQSQMRNQYGINNIDLGFGLITTTVSGLSNLTSKASMLGGWGALMGGIEATGETINDVVNWKKGDVEINATQKAKLADLGMLPSNLKQLGTDLEIDIFHEELGLYLNHYKIDTVSYNSICKYLERFGYMVNIYDDLHVNTRVGWDYLQLISFDYDTAFTVEQEESIRQIFLNGVTLLHDTNKLHGTGHNYEVSLE